MRVAVRIMSGFALAVLFVCVPLVVHAQGDPQKAILHKLSETIIQSKVASNGDITVAGSVVVLQQDGLQACAITSPVPMDTTYKNGKLSKGSFGWGFALGLQKIDSNTIPRLNFKTGDKLWITAYSVDKNGINLKFWSDPINDIRYYGLLRIPFAKGGYPSVEDAMKTVAEVITVDGPVQSAPEPAPAPAPVPPEPVSAAVAPIEPPPPPPDAAPVAPKSISLGQTKDQVAAIFGVPQKVAKLGPKEIDYYPDMKVIFVNGKVTDIQ
jgi:hypothetical protein